MSTPEDPFAVPGGEPQPNQPPAIGQPAYGQPPAYGQAPGYGQPPAYGQPAGGWTGPPLASWGSRVGSSLIDGLISSAIYLGGLGIGYAIGGPVGGALIIIGYVGSLIFSLWNWSVQGRTGQTVGKRALGTRLLREQDGQVVGAGTSIGRGFLHIVDVVTCYIGFLWPLWDKRRQTFADKILKTVVIAK